METLVENDHKFYITKGLNPEGEVATFAVAETKVSELRRMGLTIRLVQLYYIVGPGLIVAEHIFQGLKRPLLCDDNPNGDTGKFVYTWAAKTDWDYDVSKRFDQAGLIKMPPPENSVYAVITTPNLQKDRFPSVDFWIDRWFWVDQAHDLPGAPIDHQNRFSRQIR